MSNSVGLYENQAKWSAALARLLERLRSVYAFETTISTEPDFRDAFDGLSQEQHDNPPDVNCAFFFRFHVQILFFMRVVDDSVQLKSPNTLSDVFWTTALGAVKTGFKRRLTFNQIKGVYKHLNANLPLFSSDLSQSPRDVVIQEPLRDIFTAYIECYLELIKQYGSAEGIDIESVKDSIADASEVYRESESEWRLRFERAVEEQKKIIHLPTGGAEVTDTRFEHLRDLGKGAYGAVDAVREISTGTVYARKSIPVVIQGSDPSQIEDRVKNEVETMTKLRHNHIASINLHFKGTHYWTLIMSPVADCDLRTYLDEKCERAGYPQNAMRLLDSWFGCLVSALAYTHAEQVKHEDIKPSNILIKDSKIYLTDFGTAKDFSELEASTVSDFSEQGTPIYWAPEPRLWGRSADVFALGCVFSEMLTIRQRRTLQEYRKFRFNPTQEFGYAYRSNMKKVRSWLQHKLDGIDNAHPIPQLICEQTLNMLTEDSQQRLEAKRVRHNLRMEESLFCATCY